METPKTILFVDDDKFLLDMYTLKFSKNNFKVSTANSPEEALRVLRGGLNPDILLLDVVMPGLDGVDLLTIIRKENLAKNSMVVMLTNQGLQDDIAKAKKLNVDSYIIKSTTVPSEVLSEVMKNYENHQKNNLK